MAMREAHLIVLTRSRAEVLHSAPCPNLRVVLRRVRRCLVLVLLDGDGRMRLASSRCRPGLIGVKAALGLRESAEWRHAELKR